jgi:hypothetical protein
MIRSQFPMCVTCHEPIDLRTAKTDDARSTGSRRVLPDEDQTSADREFRENQPVTYLDSSRARISCIRSRR